MKLSLFSQSLFALPLERAIPAAAAAGYRSLELACTAPHLDLAAARADGAAWTRRLSDVGLTVSALSLFNRFTEADTAGDQVASAMEFVRLAPLFGTAVVKLTPGPPASAQATEAHWALLDRALAALEPVAVEVGVRLAVETHMRQLTDTAAGTAQLLRRAPSARVGLTADFSNLAFAGDDPVAAVAAFAPRLYNVHVKNGEVAADGSWRFLPLGQGWTDWPAVLKALRRVGYGGYLTVECLQPEARERPEETARRDRLILERYLHEE